MIPSTQAANRLLRLWQEVKDEVRFNHDKFIRWRCATAVQECFPFSNVDVGQCGRLDGVSLWFTPDCLTSSTESTAVVRLLREMRSGKSVERGALQPIETHLGALISRKDLRAIDELLLALQMPLHADFHDLQKVTRRASWELHRHMLPCSPWILDGALLHPLSLWIGQGYRCGRTQGTSWYASTGRYPGQGNVAQPKTIISRLHVSFDQFCQSDTPLDRNMLNGAKFVYAWSILYWSLQYTSAPLEDRLYRLLFIDCDVFSFSQLFKRVRQVCRYALVDHAAFQHVSLDGFDRRHRQVAALGSLQLDNEYTKKDYSLTAELAGLAQLREELDSTFKRTPSAGLRHLLGIVTVYQGYTLVETAEEMFQTDFGQTCLTASPSAIRSHLSQARDRFEEALVDCQNAKLGEIARQAGEGLIRVQDLFSDLNSLLYPAHDENRRAQDMLEVCNKLRVTLRSRLIQAAATPAYRFEWKGEHLQSLSTGTEEPASSFYEAGERSLHQLGQEEAAFDWLHGASEDWSRGQKLQRSFQAACPTLAMPGEPVFTTEGILANHRDEETSRLAAEGQLSAHISSTIWPHLLPEIDRAVVAQFSLSRPDGKVQIHLRHSDGTSSREVCNITYEKVVYDRAHFQKDKWASGRASPLRNLDVLVTALRSSAQNGELVILVPGPVCRAVLLHALEISTGQALWRAADVIYVPELDTLAGCMARGRATPGHLERT